MKIVYFIAAFYLGILGISALFVELNKINWFWKLVLGLFAIVAVILTFAYQHIEKKMDEWQKQNAEMRAEHQAQVINQKLDALKEKEKKGLLQDSDYSLYIVRYLESIDHTLKFRDGKNTREWLITYYKALQDIPDYFNPQEWAECEKLIYENMLQEIDGHFNMRGTFGSGMHKELLELFKNERDRLVRAKERQFNK